MSSKLDDKFSPAWWLRGPHLQTLWSQYFRRRRLADFRTEALTTLDGDYVHLHHHDVEARAPRLVLLHGLEGSARSHYVHGLARGARDRGWNFTLLVFRGCSEELNRAPRMYHSGETTDLRLTLGMLAGRFPDQRLLLAGVSLGGNVLLKYLGEDPRGVPSQLVAAAAMSVPFDLEAGSRYLQKGFSRVYDRHFVQKLRAKAIRKLEQYPGLFDRKRLNAAKTIEDFDHVVTAPVHGFLGSHDYYTRSSSIHYISSIQLPTLLLSAKDDPFLPASVLQRVAELARENSALAIEFTDRGGHVGFLGGAVPFRPIYWGERRLLNFLEEQLRYLPA